MHLISVREVLGLTPGYPHNRGFFQFFQWPLGQYFTQAMTVFLLIPVLSLVSS
jgi:hypothetical protein